MDWTWWFLPLALAAGGCAEPPPADAEKPVGTAGTPNAGGTMASAAGAPETPAAGGPEKSENWTWSACGTIPSVPSATVRGELGQTFDGHPSSTDGRWVSSVMTALAISADGKTLVSMGGVTLVWDVAPGFADSRAHYVVGAGPEQPRAEVSADGQWLAISGDGGLLVSRDGARKPGVDISGDGVPGAGSCWPAEARFSPDGQWLAITPFSPIIDVFRVSDLNAATETGESTRPSFSLPAPCGILGRGPGAPSQRIAFSLDGQSLVTETGAEFRVGSWEVLHEGQGQPQPHTYNGDLEVWPRGGTMLSECRSDYETLTQDCGQYAGRYPRFSSGGNWMLAGGTLTHTRLGEQRVLDPTAVVGIFTPNDDIIVAAYDNSLTRYCKSE